MPRWLYMVHHGSYWKHWKAWLLRQYATGLERNVKLCGAATRSCSSFRSWMLATFVISKQSNILGGWDVTRYTVKPPFSSGSADFSATFDYRRPSLWNTEGDICALLGSSIASANLFSNLPSSAAVTSKSAAIAARASSVWGGSQGCG